MNALFGAICDVYVLKLATHLYGPKAGGFAVSINCSVKASICCRVVES